MVFLFLFKQKTAYEVRISDWSSDVCSSDLRLAAISRRDRFKSTAAMTTPAIAIGTRAALAITLTPNASHATPIKVPTRTPMPRLRRICPRERWTDGFIGESRLERSEEHTSELQSLMRISYAVFCLKKKKNTYNTTPWIRVSINTHKTIEQNATNHN